MFTTHAERIRLRVDTILRAVQSADMVRTLLAEPAFDPLGMPPGNGQEAGQWLKKNAPTTVAWKEFDHNAAMTALYAAYESCVYDLLVDWITNVMPVRWPKFTENLPDFIQASYVTGIARLIPEMGKGRYRALALKDVAKNLADSTAGSQPYHLHPEAFFTNDQNLRGSRLNELLRSVGIDDAWTWLCQHPSLIDYLDNVVGGGSTLENELNRFVQARNEAAHGSTGTYLGISELERLSIFAERLSIAIIEKARHGLVRHYLSVGRAQCVGTVTEVFKKPGAVIVKSAVGCEVVSGTHHAILSDRCCDFGELLSCEVDDVPHTTFVPTVEKELGLKFTCLPREGTEVIRFLPFNHTAEVLGAHI